MRHTYGSEKKGSQHLETLFLGISCLLLYSLAGKRAKGIHTWTALKSKELREVAGSEMLVIK